MEASIDSEHFGACLGSRCSASGSDTSEGGWSGGTRGWKQ